MSRPWLWYIALVTAVLLVLATSTLGIIYVEAVKVETIPPYMQDTVYALLAIQAIWMCLLVAWYKWGSPVAVPEKDKSTQE